MNINTFFAVRRSFMGLMPLFALLSLVSITGCTHQSELPPQVTTDLVDLRSQLLQSKAQIQITCNTARDLIQRPQAELDPQIKRLVQSINTLESMAANNRTQFSSAEEHAQAYFAQWEQQMKGMSQSIAQEGEARRSKSMASFDELQARVTAFRQDFRPFMASLQEIAKYLQTDTTAAGVKAITPQIQAAVNREDGLMDKIDAVIAQIDAMRGGK